MPAIPKENIPCLHYNRPQPLTLYNLVLTLYATKHLRSDAIFEVSHQNDSCTEEKLALVLISGKGKLHSPFFVLPLAVRSLATPRCLSAHYLIKWSKGYGYETISVYNSVRTG